MIRVVFICFLTKTEYGTSPFLMWGAGHKRKPKCSVGQKMSWGSVGAMR